jgi:hypothetical protein
MKYGIVPPTINHFTDDENIDLNSLLMLHKKEK